MELTMDLEHRSGKCTGVWHKETRKEGEVILCHTCKKLYRYTWDLWLQAMQENNAGGLLRILSIIPTEEGEP